MAEACSCRHMMYRVASWRSSGRPFVSACVPMCSVPRLATGLTCQQGWQHKAVDVSLLGQRGGQPVISRSSLSPAEIAERSCAPFRAGGGRGSLAVPGGLARGAGRHRTCAEKGKPFTTSVTTKPRFESPRARDSVPKASSLHTRLLWPSVPAVYENRGGSSVMPPYSKKFECGTMLRFPCK